MSVGNKVTLKLSNKFYGVNSSSYGSTYPLSKNILGILIDHRTVDILWINSINMIENDVYDQVMADRRVL